MLARFIDFTTGSVSHAERLVSTIGGCLAIFSIFTISHWYAGDAGAILLVPSMGASAVLLFAVPHGALSQPWNVLGGHLLSALSGVTCYQLIPHEIAAASIAVGAAIGIMHYLRCIHPPGGATALAAVIGGDSTHVLGYQFVLTPVLLNVLVMLLIAIVFNYAFKWRRYPSWLQSAQNADQIPETGNQRRVIEHSDLVAALAQIDSFIDVSEHDLLRIYDLATGRAVHCRIPPGHIRPGHYYSNGAYGEDWSVRLIIDDSNHQDPGKDKVIYRVIAGHGRHSTGIQTRQEFANWARHEVVMEQDGWKRIEAPPSSR